MKPTKLLLGIAGIALLSGAYVTAHVAYAEGRDAKEHRKADVKEHEPEEHDGDTRDMPKGVPRTVTLSNPSSMTIQELEITLSGKDRKDFRQSNDCGEELKAKSSCTISVMFMPITPGPKAATVEVHSSGGSKVVYLSGTGM